MRKLKECTAEVFRRSEQRIRERRRKRNRVLALCVPVILIAAVWSAMSLPAVMPEGGTMGQDRFGESAGSAPESVACPDAAGEDFAFSFTWGCYGVSSYDSRTGRLVKTTDATNPEDYITTYWLTAEQKQEIRGLISDLDITAYPDTYDPHANGLASDPSMTLILSVNTGAVQKTVTAANIAMSYRSDDPDGQRFLDVCKAIENILTETEEWKTLPEYEFFYE